MKIETKLLLLSPAISQVFDVREFEERNVKRNIHLFFLRANSNQGSSKTVLVMIASVTFFTFSVAA